MTAKLVRSTSREGLIGEGLADRPSDVEVSRSDVVDLGGTGAQAAPEAIGDRMAEAVAGKPPSLEENVVGGQQRLVSGSSSVLRAW